MGSNGMSIFGSRSKRNHAKSPIFLKQKPGWIHSGTEEDKVAVTTLAASGSDPEVSSAADTLSNHSTVPDESDEEGDYEDDEDNDRPPPKEDPIDQDTDEQDATMLESGLLLIERYLQTEACKVNQRNTKPLRQFQESIYRCAYIRLKQTLHNSSRNEDAAILTTLAQPMPGCEIDGFAAQMWANIITTSQGITLDEKDNVLAHLMVCSYGKSDSTLKEKTMEEQLAYFLDEAQTRNPFYVCRDIESEIKQSFNLIPQQMAVNLLSRGTLAMDNVKKSLHGHIMKYIHRDLLQLGADKPILKEPQLLDLLKAGGIPVDVWVRYCRPHLNDCPRPRSGPDAPNNSEA